MKPQELTVNVNCDLTVTKETAETCLKLVELYVNSHENLDVYGNRNVDGSLSLYFKEKSDYTDTL